MNHTIIQKITKIAPFAALSSVLIAGQVFAATATPKANPSDSSPTTAFVTAVKPKADNEIQRRITLLNNMLTKVTASNNLSADSKTSLTAQINAEITALKALQTKIDADTDPAAFKTDVQAVIAEFKNFRTILPKGWLLSALDALSSAATKLSSAADELNTKIQAMKTAGKDTTAPEAALADMKAKIADAKTKIADVQSTVPTVTPDDFDKNAAALSGKRDELMAARQDLNTARTDAGTIISELKAFNSVGNSSGSTTGATNGSGANSSSTTTSP